MKKILLLLVLVALGNNVFAYLSQGHFRWRNNDGNETAATWKAPQDTNIKITDFKAIRLRLEVYNSNATVKNNGRSLQYATSINGPWYNITNNSAINAFNLEGNTAYLSNNDSTTMQLVDPSWGFLKGNIVTTEDSYNDSIPASKRREYEWCIKPTANIAANTTYYFKTDLGSTPDRYPSLTTSGTAFTPATAKVLTNGGFENNITGWTTSVTNGAAATLSVTTAPLHVHSGSKAVIINVTNTGTASNSVTLSATPVTLDTAGYYMLRFWALASVRNAFIDINIKSATASNTCHYQIYNRFDTTKNGWQMYQYAFRVGQSPVTLQMNFNSKSIYYLDDVEIVSAQTNPEIDLRTSYDWQDNWDETFGWQSGDNGNPVVIPDGRTVFVYNDSNVGPIDPHNNVIDRRAILNNLLEVQSGDHLKSIYGGTQTSPQNLFSPNNGNQFWNAGGIVENGQLKTILIEIANSSSYVGNTWIGTVSLPDLKKVSLTKLPATITTSPNCAFQDGAYDYLYFGASSTANEVHTVVGRVPAGQLDSQTAWQFYTGNGNWSTDFNQAANLVEGASAANVLKIGPNNYAMSAVPNLSSEIDVWFASSPTGPWVNKTTVYNIPQEEGILAYEGHMTPLDSKGNYSFSWSLFPFVTEPDGSSGEDAMQRSDKGVYLPCYAKANLLKLSPFSGNPSADSLLSVNTTSYGRQLIISFKTAQLHHDHITIEQSTDGTNWTSVGTVAGTDTTTASNAYTVKIPNPQNGQNYYRAKLYDEDNKLTTTAAFPYLAKSNVVLAAFTAAPGQHNVNINFTAATEFLNDHYTIETSPDTTNWTVLATIQGAGTIMDHTSSYTYTDNTTVSGIIYYRLHYYSAGNLVYSSVQKVDTRPLMNISSGSGQLNGNSLTIQINSSSEVNNPSFTIQKSHDGVAWTDLTTIPGSGTTTTPHSYFYTDNNLYTGLNYYRVMFYYHGTLYATPARSGSLGSTAKVNLTVYPNPGNNDISFDLKNYAGKSITATLTSLYGKQLVQKTLQVNSSGHYLLQSGAESGTYILNISGDNLSKTTRVLVNP